MTQAQDRGIVTLGALSEANARERPGKIAFTFEGRETSFGEFGRHARQVAHGLIAAGVAKGERVAHLGKNSDRYFEALFGAALAGAVMTPVNWRLAGPEIVYILNDCRAKVLFVGPELVEAVRAFEAQLQTVELIVSMEGEAPPWPEFGAWRAAQADGPVPREAGPGDVAIQLYTSGTTGRPKGAMLTHGGLFGLRQLPGVEPPDWNRWTDADVGLVAMPVFHIGGSGFGVQVLYNGASGVITREFDPNGVLDLIEAYGVSKMFLVPAAMQIVLRHPRAREVDYSRIKYILYGASPIPLDLLREAMQVFGCGFVQMYGMTETCGTIVALPPEDHTPEGSPRMRSAGKALPGVEVKIIDETGAELPRGQVGEIATRSVANMAGYWNLAEATAATIDKDGWLRTGDAGYMDEDGYVFIHDRVKDMIISGGENIYPAEVENAVFGHPAVADVGVIGVPSERWGEEVKACVVLKDGAKATPAEIIAWARERIAAYKAPKSVDFIAALPRNPSGKILRRELREPFWAGRERRVS